MLIKGAARGSQIVKRFMRFLNLNLISYNNIGNESFPTGINTFSCYSNEDILKLFYFIIFRLLHLY